MNFLGTIAGVLFEKIIGGIVDWIKGARRDASLRKLGHAENEIEHMKADREKAKQAQEIYREIMDRDLSIDDVIDRL